MKRCANGMSAARTSDLNFRQRSRYSGVLHGCWRRTFPHRRLTPETSSSADYPEDFRVPFQVLEEGLAWFDAIEVRLEVPRLDRDRPPVPGPAEQLDDGFLLGPLPPI